jgi:mRNA-degrading endonuclease RelE of RelBE toxin-antitoxin system
MTQKLFQVNLDPSTQKDLKNLSHHREKIINEILDLEKNPAKGHNLQGSLQGIKALEFRIKGSGEYRAAYLFWEEESVCLVFAIGTHENFYDLVERRVKSVKPLLEKVREANRKKSEKKTPTSKTRKA